jgi:hypothetical protein
MVCLGSKHGRVIDTNVVHSLFWDIYIALVYGVLYVSSTVTCSYVLLADCFRSFALWRTPSSSLTCVAGRQDSRDWHLSVLE